MQGTLLLIGVCHDPVLCYFAQFLHDSDYPAVFLNQARIGTDIHVDSHGWYLPDNTQIKHSNVQAVFCRLAGFMPHQTYPSSVQYANTLLYHLLDYQYPTVINRPSSLMSNTSKLYQSFCVKNTAFKQPESACLANVKLTHVSDNIIYKSMSSVRSIVKPLCGDVRSQHVVEPVLMQSHVKGRNVRVHVVGDQCFALAIESETLDYRYSAAKTFALHTLPSDMHDACVHVCRSFGLYFAGVDLILCDGVYYFLEANPSPGYDYFEQHMPGNPISNALLNSIRKGCGYGYFA